MKKSILFLLLIILFIPYMVYAYSDYIIASGKNIGIELKADYLLVVGTYNIGSYDVSHESNIKIGDKIVKINDVRVKSIDELNNLLVKSYNDTINITYLRDNKEYNENIKLIKENGEYRTGLYIRDTVRGVATLTYIDAENGNFGALGHEILERSTKNRFEVNDGTIFSSIVTGITRSFDGNPGEKNARSDSTIVYGHVIENTSSGIFGKYTDKIPQEKLYKVAKKDEIKRGFAKIRTVIHGEEVSEYDINILKINEVSKNKNILFEVTDKKLLEETGGIIQGMSGSPIIQDDKIIGAVNYVLVDSPNKGYGIFITNMLEEAEN